MSHSEDFSNLKPEPIWRYFREICQIPHESKNEEGIIRYVLGVAERLGLSAARDPIGNVVVRKPASAGCESYPSVALQSHLDMVCEKNAGTVHDFAQDPIQWVRQGNFLMARGTTLGADNGIGVAAALALMEDRHCPHGPLEMLFTVDEETGLTGAAGLSGDFLASRILINLDSEEEGILYVGCAGGRDTCASWPVLREVVPGGCRGFLLKVGGLLGGHSGMEIHKSRGNAIKILNRVLLDLLPLGVRIASLQGGNKHNAIPREANALLAVPADQTGTVSSKVAAWDRTVREELASIDSGVWITLAADDGAELSSVWDAGITDKICLALSAVPHGVAKMSADIRDLVETSTNLATIQTGKDAVKVVTSQRSSVASEIAEMRQTVASVFRLSGAEVSGSKGYPGWKPNLASPVLNLSIVTYRNLFGREPEIKAVHAGLECGLIGEKFPGMDMVSFGPTLEGVHSPDEKVHIDTVERFWLYLCTVLQNVR